MEGTLIGFVAGAVVAGGLWLALRQTFAAPVFARQNYRRATVPVGAGIVLVLTLVLLSAVAFGLESLGSGLGPRLVNPAGSHAVWAVRGSKVPLTSMLLSDASGTEALGPTLTFLVVLIAASGLGLLGLFDDLGASGDDRGFRGHLGALGHGRLTTGGVKLVFGGLLSLALAAQLDGRRPGRVVVDTLLIALAANLGNLFDRAPGRTTKVALLAAVPLLGFAHQAYMTPVAIVVGAGAGLLLFDLREELMLGDAGANVLGGVLGLGVVLSCPFPARIVVLAVLVALNAASEKVSFSKVIDGVAPLRALDRLGRRPPGPPPDPDLAG